MPKVRNHVLFYFSSRFIKKKYCNRILQNPNLTENNGIEMTGNKIT